LAADPVDSQMTQGWPRLVTGWVVAAGPQDRLRASRAAQSVYLRLGSSRAGPQAPLRQLPRPSGLCRRSPLVALAGFCIR
jgi:hypothetical protein